MTELADDARPGVLHIASAMIEENLEPCVRFAIAFNDGAESAVMVAADDAWDVAGLVAQTAAIATQEAALAQFLIAGGMEQDAALQTVVAARVYRADRWATEGTAVTEQGPISI